MRPDDPLWPILTLPRLGLRPVQTQWAKVTMTRASDSILAYDLIDDTGNRVAGQAGLDQWRWRAADEAWIVTGLGPRLPLDSWPPQWPVWGVRRVEQPLPLAAPVLQLRLQVAWRADCPVYAELAWTPARGSEGAICGADLGGVKQEHVVMGWQGLRLLQHLQRALEGRRKWSGVWESPEHFTRVVASVVREIRQRKRNPLAKDVCQYLHNHNYGKASPSQFSGWLHDAGYKDFDDFLRRAT